MASASTPARRPRRRFRSFSPPTLNLLWEAAINDSQDLTRDDLFPNLAFRKSAVYFSPDQALTPPPPGMDPASSVVAGYDEVWTKIPGHGAASAISAGAAREVWQDGNMATQTTNLPVAVSSFTID